MAASMISKELIEKFENHANELSDDEVQQMFPRNGLVPYDTDYLAVGEEYGDRIKAMEEVSKALIPTKKFSMLVQHCIIEMFQTLQISGIKLEDYVDGREASEAIIDWVGTLHCLLPKYTGRKGDPLEAEMCVDEGYYQLVVALNDAAARTKASKGTDQAFMVALVNMGDKDPQRLE